MSLWRYPCDDPACGSFERVHRPYAKARGSNYKPSVSAFAELVAGGGDGLVGHGAREAGYVSQWQAHTLSQLDIEDAVTKITRTVMAMRNTDAQLGTEAHKAPEAWAVGAQWLEPYVEYEHDRDRLWNFVAGEARWWEVRQPDVLCCEFIVSNDDPDYVGTGDLIAEIDGVVTYVDWKTHRRHKPDESVSFPKWALQGNMLSLARELRHYHANKLVGSMAWDDSGLPRPTRGLVVSVGPEGQVREYGYDIDPASLDVVRAAATVLSFKPAVAQLTGVPVTVPKFEPRPSAPANVEAMLG